MHNSSAYCSTVLHFLNNNSRILRSNKNMRPRRLEGNFCRLFIIHMHTTLESQAALPSIRNVPNEIKMKQLMLRSVRVLSVKILFFFLLKQVKMLLNEFRLSSVHRSFQTSFKLDPLKLCRRSFPCVCGQQKHN